MPTYDFRDRASGEVKEYIIRMTELDSFKEEHPELEHVILAPKIVRDVGSRIKVDDGFRESMSRLKETYKINKIKDY